MQCSKDKIIFFTRSVRLTIKLPKYALSLLEDHKKQVNVYSIIGFESPFFINYLIIESEVVTGKSQPEALPQISVLANRSTRFIDH